MRDTILLERYKYISQQKSRLNDITFKVAAFYQAVMLVILAAQFRVIELSQQKGITVELGRLGSWGLFWSAAALTTVSLLLLLGGIAAWFDYRKEEVLLEKELTGAARPLPSLKGIFRWYETYVALTMLGVVVAYWFVLHHIVLSQLF